MSQSSLSHLNFLIWNYHRDVLLRGFQLLGFFSTLSIRMQCEFNEHSSKNHQENM